MEKSDRLVWFLTGAALGAAVALLYAPQSGRDTRRYIGKKAKHGKEAFADVSRDAIDKGRGGQIQRAEPCRRIGCGLRDRDRLRPFQSRTAV